jgi:histidyl-tRNA synthetase
MSLTLQPYKGTRDLYPEDFRLRNYIFDAWRKTAQSFGYEEYAAPMLEPLEIYAAKSGEEIVNEQTYTFTDRGDRKVAIRPEMTPSIARMVAARRQEMPYPARLFSIANFMRYERPQKGREREFWQLNVDIFGATEIDADAEIIELADKILRKFGATDDMFTIRVNDRRLTDFVMREYLGLDDNQSNRMIKLFDRRAKIARDVFENQVAIIVSGDGITCGAMDEDAYNAIEKIKKLLKADNLDDLPAEIRDNAPIDDLKNLFQKLRAAKITNAKFDPTLMRGFDYYTGIVFEAFDNAPENNRAMFGGGRYDGLIGLFGVEPLPVVGMAPGETTMIEFLRAHNLVPELKPATDVVIIPVGAVDVAPVADELRAGGVNVAVDYTDRKVDKKIRAAVKSGAPYLLFVGESEIAEQKFVLKNVETQEERKLSIGQIIKLKEKL